MSGMCSAKQCGCRSWELEPAFLSQDAHSRKDRGAEIATVAGGQSATQIPAPGLLLTENGPEVYTGTLVTEYSPPPHGACKWSQTLRLSCREPGYMPLPEQDFVSPALLSPPSYPVFRPVPLCPLGPLTCDFSPLHNRCLHGAPPQPQAAHGGSSDTPLPPRDTGKG